MLPPATQTRHSGMDAEIQSQGCEILSGIVPESRHNNVALLPSMALDTGIHAGMTARAEASCESGTCLTVQQHEYQKKQNVDYTKPHRIQYQPGDTAMPNTES
jgi:hypothetical protein